MLRTTGATLVLGAATGRTTVGLITLWLWAAK
jgi:hypothetical protein